MRKLVFLLAAISAGHIVLAEEQSFRQEGTHVHGAALLNVVLENQQLFIELESPAINIVGFEHKPSTSEQKQTVHDAEMTLKNAAQLFSLANAAGCRLVEAAVEWSMDEETHDEAEHHDTEKEEHDEHGEETHSEFHAEYAFQCETPDKLEFVDVLLFQRFPGMAEIEAQVIGRSGQTALELTANSTRIDL